MFAGEGFAVPGMDEHGVGSGEILERQVGGVAVVGVQDDEVGLRLGADEGEQVACGDAGPAVVVARPGGDAVHVGDGLALREGEEAGPVPCRLLVDEAEDAEFPLSRVDVRLDAEVEDGPVADEMLTRWEAVSALAGDPAGEEAALGGPALLGAGELAGVGRGRFVHAACLSPKEAAAEASTS